MPVWLRIALLLQLTLSTALSASWEVCPSGCNFATIQAAINGAAPGDSIYIRPSQYNETVFLNISYLNLTGNGTYNQIIINGSAIQEGNAVLNVSGNYSNVSNLTLANGGWGLSVGGRRVTFQGSPGWGGNYSSFNRIYITNISSQTNDGGTTVGLILQNFTENVTLSNIIINNVSKGSNVTGNVIGFWLSEFANNTNITNLNMSNLTMYQGGYVVYGIRVQNGGSLWRGNVSLFNLTLSNNYTSTGNVISGIRFDTMSGVSSERYAGANQTNFSADLNITIVNPLRGGGRAIDLGLGVVNISFYGRVDITNVTSNATTADVIGLGGDHAIGIAISTAGTSDINFYGPVTVNNISGNDTAVGIYVGWDGLVQRVNFSGPVLVGNVSSAANAYGVRILSGTHRFNGTTTIMNVSANSSGPGDGLAYGFHIGTAGNTINSTTVLGVTADNTSDDTRGIHISAATHFIPTVIVGNITGSNAMGISITGVSGITLNNVTTSGVITSTDVYKTGAGTNNIDNSSFRSTANNSINLTAFTGTFNTTNVSYNVSNVSYETANTGTFRAFWLMNVTVSASGGGGLVSALVRVNNSSGTQISSTSTAADGTITTLMLVGVTRSGATTTNSYPINVSATRAGYVRSQNTSSLIDSNSTAFFLSALPAPVSWTVCSTGANYSYVQNAINNATAGDTINICPGMYNETVVANVSYINITGNGTYGQVVINGTNQSGLAAVNITSTYANLSNLSITNGAIGVIVAANWTMLNRISIENITDGATTNDARGLFVSPYVENSTFNTVRTHNISKSLNGNVTGSAFGVHIGQFAITSNFTDINSTLIQTSRQDTVAIGLRISGSGNRFTGQNYIAYVNYTNTTAIGTAYGILFVSDGGGALPSQTNFTGLLNISFIRAATQTAAGIYISAGSNMMFGGDINMTNITSEGEGTGQSIARGLWDLSSGTDNFSGIINIVNISSNPTAGGGTSAGIALGGTSASNNFTYVNIFNASQQGASGGMTGLWVTTNGNQFLNRVVVQNISAAGTASGATVTGSTNAFNSIRIDGVAATAAATTAYGLLFDTGGGNNITGALEIGNVTSSSAAYGFAITGTATASVNNLSTNGTISNSSILLATTSSTSEIANSSNLSSSPTYDVAFGSGFTGTVNMTNVSFSMARLNASIAAATGVMRAYWWVNVTVVDGSTLLGITDATVSFRNSSLHEVATSTSGSAGVVPSTLLWGVAHSAGSTTARYPFTISASKTGYATASSVIHLTGSNTTTVRILANIPPGGGGGGGGGDGGGDDGDGDDGDDGGGDNVIVEPCVGLCLPPDQPHDPETKIETTTQQGQTGGGLTQFACYLPSLPPPRSDVYTFIDARNSTTNRTQCNWQLRFNVPNDWLKQAGITPENVTLMVLDGNDWKQVYTENISSDENNTYYRAFTPKINGIFAIATREESETELKQLSQPAWPQPGTRITALAAQRFGVLSQSMPELLVIGILSAVVSYFYIGNVRRFA